MVEKQESRHSHFGELSVLPPKPFNATAPERWQQWIARFEQYLTITDMVNQRDSIKCALLCEAVGKSASQVVRPDPEESVTYMELKMQFAHHFNVVDNVDFQRAIFKARSRRAGESVGAYVDALCSLAETCDFGPYKADLVKDRLACGIGDERVQRCIKVLGLQNVTLAKVVEIARVMETQDLEGTKADFSQQHPPRLRRYTMERKKFEFKLYDDSWNLPPDKDEKKTATAQIQKKITTDQVPKEIKSDQIQKEVTTAAQIENMMTTAQVEKEVAIDKIEKGVTTAVIEKDIVTDQIEEEVTTVQIEKQIVTYQVKKKMTTDQIQKDIATDVIENEGTDQIQKVVTNAEMEKEMEIDQIHKVVTTAQIEKDVSQMTYQVKEKVKTDLIKEAKTDQIEEVKTDQIEEVKTDQIEEVKTDLIEEMKTDEIEEVKTDLIEEMKTDEIEEVKIDQIEEASSQKIKKKELSHKLKKKTATSHIKKVTNHIKKKVTDKIIQMKKMKAQIKKKNEESSKWTQNIRTRRRIKAEVTTNNPNLPEYLTNAHNALMRHVSHGDLGVAEHLCMNWHKEMEKMEPPSTCAKMLALRFLGLYHRIEDNNKLAAEAYKDLLAIQKKRIHPFHPELGKTYTALGEILTSTKDHKQAELMWREALDIREETVGQNDFGVVKEVSNVALALQNQGSHEHAEKYYDWALALYELNVEPDHPQISITRSKIKRCIKREEEVKKRDTVMDRPRNPITDTDQILDAYEEVNIHQMYISSLSLEGNKI